MQVPDVVPDADPPLDGVAASVEALSIGTSQWPEQSDRDAADDFQAPADVPVLLVDLTSLSRGAVRQKEGHDDGGIDGEQQQLAQRLLRHLSEARDFDSQCEAFLYQHAFCRMSSHSDLSRDTRSYSQSLPASHVIAPLPFPPLINGVSSAVMHARVCAASPHSCVTLIKQLLKQCLHPLHWKYACSLELERMAAACAVAAPFTPPQRHSLPDFQLIHPHCGFTLYRTCHTRHTPLVTRHSSHVTRHTSHVTRHTSHVTRHSSHVTRHTSHVTRHTSHVVISSRLLAWDALLGMVLSRVPKDTQGPDCDVFERCCCCCCCCCCC